jgi:hypothetical protein
MLLGNMHDDIKVNDEDVAAAPPLVVLELVIKKTRGTIAKKTIIANLLTIEKTLDAVLRIATAILENFMLKVVS